MTGDLGPALAGERVDFDSPVGRLNMYVAGTGEPLLLIHSINAAASAAEVRPLHDHYRATRTVFSVDLPGYGFSDRSDRTYSPRLMTDAIHAFVAEIATRLGGGSLDALAVSLSCEFLARAASESPDSFRSIALVSPTGFRGLRPWRGAPGSTRGKPWLYRALRGPGNRWGESIFRALTKPSVIRYFLRRTWGSNDIDEQLFAYDVESARASGAEHAPLHFLAAMLFSADIHTVYEKLSMPVWASHGVRGDFTDYRGICIVENRSNWHVSIFSTGALPYFEMAEEFCAAYDRFLGMSGSLHRVG